MFRCHPDIFPTNVRAPGFEMLKCSSAHIPARPRPRRAWCVRICSCPGSTHPSGSPGTPLARVPPLKRSFVIWENGPS
eukprot:1185524-Prorocentrum_minimum.AAC.2